MSTSQVLKQAQGASAFKNASDQVWESGEENVESPQKGDGPLASLLQQYAGIVYWLAWFITDDKEEAEDVLQRTFLKVDSDFTQFQQSRSPATSLMRIALGEVFSKRRNRDAGKLRQLSLEAEAEAAFAPQEVVEWGDRAEQRYTSEELRKIVHNAIRCLTPFSRIVFLLHDAAKLETHDIADLLHLPAPSIKSCLLRSRLQLRNHLNDYFKPTFKEQAG
jgi:RNA polymerase sigma-70 factor, ECF subfamily